MATASAQEITQLLQAWGKDDEAALEKLTPLVYAELHRLAKHYMVRERPEHLLQTTALVNEAYLRLIDWRKADWQNRAHFFGLSAHLMRNILVDVARKSRRGGGVGQVSLDEACLVSPPRGTDLVPLDKALKALSTLARISHRPSSRGVASAVLARLATEASAVVLVQYVEEADRAKHSQGG